MCERIRIFDIFIFNDLRRWDQFCLGHLLCPWQSLLSFGSTRFHDDDDDDTDEPTMALFTIGEGSERPTPTPSEVRKRIGQANVQNLAANYAYFSPKYIKFVVKIILSHQVDLVFPSHHRSNHHSNNQVSSCSGG